MMRSTSTTAALTMLWLICTFSATALAQEAPFIGPRPPSAAEVLRFTKQMPGNAGCAVCHSQVIMEGLPQPERQWLDMGLYAQSVHAKLACTECHTDIPVDSHGLAAVRSVGLSSASPGQVGPIPGLPGLKPKSPSASAALASCINCHDPQYETYRHSVHGMDVLTLGDPLPAYCTDCHGTHYILPASDERSWTNLANVSLTCLQCHAVPEVRQRYGLTLDVAGTFQKSFHGLRGELGAGRVANCVTCHGHHDVYRIDDQRAHTQQASLAQVCGECHEGARLDFAAAFSHKKISPDRADLALCDQAGASVADRRLHDALPAHRRAGLKRPRAPAP